MKKKMKFTAIIIVWTLILTILYKTGLLTTDIEKIKNIISGSPLKMQILFVLLSTFRVIFFIPQTVFIFIGSFLFGPYVGFLLSFIALILSQSIMYVIGKYFNKQVLGEDFYHKNKNIINIIKEHGYMILALGIVCPITPSDLITSSAAFIKLKYRKCMAVIAASDAPMIFLYGFLGTGFSDSAYLKVFSLICIVFISYYTFLIWNKINNKYRATL